jgi:predicted MFS family arabinose efflux permease
MEEGDREDGGTTLHVICITLCFLGVSLGSLLGGVLYDKFDGATTFRIYGVVSLGLFVLHFLVQTVISRKMQVRGKGETCACFVALWK